MNPILTFTYDPAGNELTATDANGHTTTSTYDTRSRMLTPRDGAGGVTTYHYDNKEQLVWAQDPRRNLTTLHVRPALPDCASRRTRSAASPSTGTRGGSQPTRVIERTATRRTTPTTRGLGSSRSRTHTGTRRSPPTTGRTTSSRSPTSSATTTSYGYDEMNRRTSTTDALQRDLDDELRPRRQPHRAHGRPRQHHQVRL